MLKGLMVMVMPRVAKALGLEAFDRESLEFFADVVKQTVESRKGKKTRKGDMVDLLSEALSLRGDMEEEDQTQVESDLETASLRRKVPSIPADQGDTEFFRSTVVFSRIHDFWLLYRSRRCSYRTSCCSSSRAWIRRRPFWPPACTASQRTPKFKTDCMRRYQRHP